MSARFRGLRKPINLDAFKTTKVTLACCVLHNFLICRNKALYAPRGAFDQTNSDGDTVPGKWRKVVEADSNMLPLQKSRHREPLNASEIRSEFVSYFTYVGDVEFQYARIG